MQRKEVPVQNQWKLEDIYSSDNLWQAEFDYIKNALPKFKKYENALTSAASIKECLDFYFDVMRKCENVYCYAKMRKDEDGKNQNSLNLASKAMQIYVEFGESTSFITPSLSALDKDFLISLSKQKEFSDYDYFIDEIIRQKQHILSNAEEKIMAGAVGATTGYSEIFNAIDNVEMPFGKVYDGQERVKLTHGKFSILLSNPDKKIRKSAYDCMYGAINKLIYTLAANYGGNVKKNIFFSSARGYNSPLEKALKNDDIPTAVYDNLLTAVNANLPKMHSYMALRKKLLNLPKMHMYDLHVSLFDDAEIKMPYADAYNMVVKALKPLGEPYVALLKQAFNERWIDVEETDNKRSGAYSWGTYDVHPYVLLNYKQTTHDIFTIAHEMGHALHSYYSNKTQPFAKAGYSIFVAEVASIVNEVLLIKYLQKNTTDTKIKNYLNQYYLDMFRTTLFRQTKFSQFEKNAHEMQANGEPLTVDSLCGMYLDLNKKWYGDAVIYDKNISLEWARIPHFYNAFYVYKYATGLTSAVALADKILKGDTNSYFKFLSAGGHKSPYLILKDAGVDLATGAPYEVAMNEFAKTLAELDVAAGGRQ